MRAKLCNISNTLQTLFGNRCIESKLYKNIQHLYVCFSLQKPCNPATSSESDTENRDVTWEHCKKRHGTPHSTPVTLPTYTDYTVTQDRGESALAMRHEWRQGGERRRAEGRDSVGPSSSSALPFLPRTPEQTMRHHAVIYERGSQRA